MVTIQQVCAHAALTVRTHRLESKNPISEADLEWIFARNYEGTEQLRKFFQISAAIAIITQKFKLINSGLHEIMIIAKPCRNEPVRSPWELAHKGLLIGSFLQGAARHEIRCRFMASYECTWRKERSKLAKPCRNESVRSPWELAHKGLFIMNTHGKNAKK